MPIIKPEEITMWKYVYMYRYYYKYCPHNYSNYVPIYYLSNVNVSQKENKQKNIHMLSISTFDTGK